MNFNVTRMNDCVTGMSRLPPNRDAGGSREPLNLRAALHAFRRHIFLFLFIAALTTGLVVALTFMLKPIYVAQSQIQLEPRQSANLQLNAQSGPPDSTLIDTEIAVIRSRPVAKAVIERLDLRSDPDFAGPEGAPLGRMIDRLLGDLTVVRESTTYVVNVQFASPSPEKAARIANAFVQEYLRFSRTQGASAAREQAEDMMAVLYSLREEVQKADAELAEYRAQKGTTIGSRSGTVTEQQISMIAAQLASAQADAAAAASTAQAARAQMQNRAIDAVSQVLQSETVRELRRQRGDLLQERGRIEKRYGTRHPESIRVKEQLDQIDAELKAEATRIIAGLENAAKAAHARVDALQAELAQLRDQQEADAQAAVRADSLQRDADAKRALYNDLSRLALQREQQAQINDTRAQVVGAAEPPLTPNFPNKPLFGFFGLITGIALGSLAVVGVELLNGSLRFKGEAEQLGFRLLGSIPALTKRQIARSGSNGKIWNYVLQKPYSTYAESLRNIRSALLFHASSGAGSHVFALTSALPGEGKTVTAISLARVMAMSGDRTLLVNCDLRRRMLQGLVSQQEVGILDVLYGKSSFEDAVVSDIVPNLDILPLIQAEFITQDVFGSEEMRRFLQEAKQKYKVVLLDSPPTLAMADARALAALSDGALFLVKWGETPKAAVTAAAERLSDDGANILGIVFTHVPVNARAQIGEDDPAYYLRHYSGYYVN